MERSGRKPGVYVGTYTQHIDAKARCILPGAFRQALGDPFIISASFDQCLALWNEADWLGFVEKEVGQRSELSQEARRLSRFLHASAHVVEIDSQRRFVVPPALRKFAALDREIVLVGSRNRVELWSKPLWESYIEKTSSSIDEIAESLSKEFRI